MVRRTLTTPVSVRDTPITWRSVRGLPSSRSASLRQLIAAPRAARRSPWTESEKNLLMYRASG